LDHSYKILYLLRPVVWGLFAMLIAVYGNRFYKKLLTAVSVFLGIMSAAGVALSMHFISAVIRAYDYGEYISDNDLIYCYVSVVMTILLIIASIGYGLMAGIINPKEGVTPEIVEKREKIIAVLKLLPIPVSLILFSVPLFLLDEFAGKIIGVVLELIGWFWLISVVKNSK